MNILAILQARMSSSRLPGKVLLKLGEKTIIEHVYQNVQKSKLLNDIFIATSLDKTDDAIEDLCLKKKIKYYRGSLENVLERYYVIAKEFKASYIVRITCDCPLVSALTIDKLISIIKKTSYDYVSNTCPPNRSMYPDGSDVEVFTFEALEKAYHSKSKYVSIEHVTFQFWQDRRYKSYQLKDTKKNYSKFRYTLDYKEDLHVISHIIRILQKQKKDNFSVEDIIDILENSDVSKINSKYYQGINW